MNPNEVKQVFSSAPFRTDNGPSTEYRAITHHLHAIKITQDKMTDALYDLRNNQDLAALNQSCQKKINALLETDGTLNGEKFKGMMENLKADLEHKFIWERNELERQADTNPRAKKFLDKLSQKFQPFFDFIENTAIMGDEIRKTNHSFSKDQVERLTSNIEMDLKEINSDYTVKLNQVTRLNHETHERHQGAKTMLQNMHSLFSSLAKSIRGA